jgi:predicted peptidase
MRASFIFLVLIIGCSKKDNVPQQPAPTDTLPRITAVLRAFPNTTINSTINGFYLSFPSNYEQTQTRYPLLIFIPGGGQFGNGSIDLPLLLRDGPAQLVDEGRFPGTFKVGDKSFSFIVLTPQCRLYPNPDEIKDCIEYAKAQYRIDTGRIYLSGLSIGGIVATNLAAQIPSKIAAIVPIAGIPLDFDNTSKCQAMASSNLPLWIFHSQDDPVIDISWANGFITKFNSYQPLIPARLTRWSNGGHDAWTRAIDPAYKENGKNIYEWMLQYHR